MKENMSTSSNELEQKPLTQKDYTSVSISNKLKKAGFKKSQRVDGDISRQQDMLRVNGKVNGEGYIVKSGRHYIEVHYCKDYDNQIDKIVDYLKSLGYTVEKYGSYPGEYCVIRYPKDLTESNELEQRAKKHKKKSKGMGWHMAFNAGDVEKGIEVFNNSTSTATTGADISMGEAIDTNTYYYNGPIYYDGRKIASKSNIYTSAPSLSIATRNILYKAANGDKELYHYDIVDEQIELILVAQRATKSNEKCYRCGYTLNDMGDCPVCDYGEDDLLESLSDLEAMWKLNSFND